MRQTSEEFMNKLLEDNTPAESKPLSEQIAEEIDKKMAAAMSKFTEALEKVNIPDQGNNNEKEKEENEQDEEGSREDGEEGADEEADN